MTRAFILLLLLGVSACVSNTDFDRMRLDVNELQKGGFEAKKDIDTLKEKTTGVVKEDTFSVVRESQANILARVNETASGLQELRGRFDENRYFIEKTLKDLTTEKELLKAQIAGLETQVRAMKERLAAADGTAAKPAEGTKETAETPQKPADAAAQQPQPDNGADAAQKPYDAAYQLFKDKKYKESREKFEAYIKENPKTDLTDNAQFWIAETYYSDKDYENAILAYETLLKKYPNSDKAVSGMLKQGFAFIEIGDAKTGRIILNRLIEAHPASKEAETARKKISDTEKKPVKKR